MKYWLLTAALVAAPATADVSFQSARTTATTESRAGSDYKQEFKDVGAAVLGPLSAQSSNISQVVNDENATTAQAVSSTKAEFSSAGKGHVVFAQSLRIDQKLVTSTSVDLSGRARAFGEFSYDFSLSRAGRFTLTYTVAASGLTRNFTPLAQIAFLQDFTQSDPNYYSDLLVDGASGTVSQLLEAGEYRLSVMDFYANDIDSYHGVLVETQLNSRFDFTISAVPEPKSWALAITGFGLIGAAARRRTAAPALS